MTQQSTNTKCKQQIQTTIYNYEWKRQQVFPRHKQQSNTATEKENTTPTKTTQHSTFKTQSSNTESQLNNEIYKTASQTKQRKQ